MSKEIISVFTMLSDEELVRHIDSLSDEELARHIDSLCHRCNNNERNTGFPLCQHCYDSQFINPLSLHRAASSQMTLEEDASYEQILAYEAIQNDLFGDAFTYSERIESFTYTNCGKECSFCCEDLQNTEVKTTPCCAKELFHSKCLDRWCSANTRCPTCNLNMKEVIENS